MTSAETPARTSDAAGSSRILTLVFTDLARSTALKTERGDQVVGALIARHRAHVERLVAASGGRIIAWAGDGCLLTFEAPSAAVLFGLGLQEAHGAEPDLPAVRVGIHMGEVTERPDRDGRRDVEGLAVDIAARIVGLAGPGQVLMSSAVYDTTRSRLDAAVFDRTVRWRMHGSYALKGLDKSLEIAEAGLDGIAPLRAPAASEKAAPLGPAAETLVRRRVPPWLAAVLVLAALSALAGYLAMRASGRGRAPARAPITSLAVLPFRNFSGDPEQEYFVDGMTEALIAELAKIRSLKVISRTSAMVYKGTDKPLPQVARELGIDGIIEGSVYKGGNEVRITAQLIRGATDEHLWSESYTETLENVLRLQAKVALAISDEIQATLSADDERRLRSAPVVVPEAHEALLKGLRVYNQGTLEGFAEAGALFRQAIKHDPAYAAAYAWLAFVYVVPNPLGLGRADFPVARALANEALRLDPDSALAHTGLGWISVISEWDWSRSEAEFRRAIALDPSDAWGDHGLSDLLADLGRFDEALAAGRAAVERGPLDSYLHWQVAYLEWLNRDYEASIRDYGRLFQLAPDFTVALTSAADTYWSAGKRDEALRLAREAIARDPTPTNRAYLAYRLALMGQGEEARRTLAQALDEGERSYLTPATVAWALSALGDVDGALRWIERGFDERDYSILDLKMYPLWDPLRGDPRFHALLQRMKFPE